MGNSTLGENVEIIMGQSPPGSSVSKSPIGVPLLNGPTEFGAHHPTPVQFTTDAKKIARPGDILFCVRGSTTGRMNWADQEYAIGRGIAAIRHRHMLSLQALVRAIIEKELPGLLTQATGSTFPNVTASLISALPYPELSEIEQRAIAHILRSLEDKIELNRRMNKALEATARAIFKSWFVDFLPVRAKQRARTQTGDPVRAKAEGRPTGLPDDIAALFPDSFEDSDLGKIPTGWEAGRVSDLADVTSGKRPQKRSKEKTAEFNVPLYGGGGVMAYVTEPMITEPFILTGRVGTLGKIFMITEACWPSDNTLLLFPKDKIHFQCLFFMLHQIDFESLNRGSTQPLVTQTDLKNQPLVIPSESIMKFYWESVYPVFEKIDKNIMESNTLASLRDTLLPKLISGELRVPDAEKFVEPACAGTADREAGV